LLWILQVSAETHQRIRIFLLETPWKFLNLDTYALAFPSLGTDGNGELAGGEERRGRQTREGDMQLGSPSPDWQWWLGRSGRRRAAAAAPGQHDRGGTTHRALV
jgi:hypothetical protein